MRELGLSNPTASALAQSKTLARKMCHPTLTTEHVVLALLESAYVQNIMDHCNVDVPSLYETVYSRTLKENVAVDQTIRPEGIALDPSVSEVLARAGTTAGAAGRHEVTLADLLVAISKSTTRRWLGDIFEEHKFDTHTLIGALTRMQSNQETETTPRHEAAHEMSGTGTLEIDPSTGTVNRRRDEELLKYSVCLTALARAGKLDPVIGRTPELERVIQTLARRTKNNPLLVGEPGVGKTAIADALAQRIVSGQVPEKLRHVRVYALNLGALVAGTKYRGDFEGRIKAILTEVDADPNIVLLIDEIHTLIGGGSASGGMDAANLFKPALATGALRVIGATTYDEYQRVFSKDRALSRRFQKVDVAEPSLDETRAILAGVRAGLETHHGVTYTTAALESALMLSERHLPDRLLPDKAIDVLDEAGARVHLAGTMNLEVDVPAIEAVIAQMARVPIGQVSTSDRDRLRGLETHLRGVIFGQDQAIQTLVKAIKMARAGIRMGDRPVASLLFAGPTGVGKTELTAQLAEHLNMPLIRFDMSEYLEAHSVSRLIGAPAGYVGHETGGLLTEAVSRAPHSVVLLDEIEKAHPSISQILLQVMDRGTLTDTHGREVNFRNTVVVLTTNAGAMATSRRTLGFLEQDHSTDAVESIRASFSPEFRNRLDAVVNFNPLGVTEIHRVVDKVLDEMNHRLGEQKIVLDVSPSARHWLAQNGYNPEMGARPMRNLMETILGEPLADAILFGDLAAGGTAVFDLVEEKVVGSFTGPVIIAVPALVEQEPLPA